MEIQAGLLNMTILKQFWASKHRSIVGVNDGKLCSTSTNHLTHFETFLSQQIKKNEPPDLQEMRWASILAYRLLYNTAYHLDLLYVVFKRSEYQHILHLHDYIQQRLQFCWAYYCSSFQANYKTLSCFHRHQAHCSWKRGGLRVTTLVLRELSQSQQISKI